MSLLLTALWPALAAGFCVGAATGFLTGLPVSRQAGAIAGTLVLIAVGLGAVAVIGLAPERNGFWVESAALVLAAYLAGCLLGGFGQAARTSRSSTAEV